MRALVVGVLLLVTTPVASCQTPVKESDTLHFLLIEVHQLRQDIEAMAVAAQRVQIALYGLQMQDAAVARATQRLENTRDTCARAEDTQQHTASEVQKLESLDSGTVPEGNAKSMQAKAIKSRINELKSALDSQMREDQTCQAAEVEASSQLRNDQAKLADLQDRIERLDKSLEQLTISVK
jgi:chromosome segregation ATPase